MSSVKIGGVARDNACLAALNTLQSSFAVSYDVRGGQCAVHHVSPRRDRELHRQ